MALTPLAAQSFGLMMTLRILSGIVLVRFDVYFFTAPKGFAMIVDSQSANISAVNKLISKWAPPVEKGRFLAALLGSDIGTVVGFSLCGVLIESLGWEYAFYVPAAMTAAFTVLFYFTMFDTPAKHPRIGEIERRYIEESLTGISAGPTVRYIEKIFKGF